MRRTERPRASGPKTPRAPEALIAVPLLPDRAQPRSSWLPSWLRVNAPRLQFLVFVAGWAWCLLGVWPRRWPSTQSLAGRSLAGNRPRRVRPSLLGGDAVPAACKASPSVTYSGADCGVRSSARRAQATADCA